MKNGLLLPGYACKSWIWDDIAAKTKHYFDLELVDWPTDLVKDFSSIQDFAVWLGNRFVSKGNEYDFVIGHSLGGLVALYLARLYPDKIHTVVLTESFITRPGLFFQNLLMESSETKLKDQIITMLQEESKFYSADLQKQLKELNLAALVEGLEAKIIAFYGDRGVRNSKIVIENLGLSQKILSKIKIHVIQNSCHFPMIENSESLAKYLIMLK